MINTVITREKNSIKSEEEKKTWNITLQLLLTFDRQEEPKYTHREKWMFDECMEMCEWRWRLVKQMMQLQNKHFTPSHGI